ncbi:MAG: rhamnose ABC transporter substrate-binding protein [Rubrivivax sp.]|nr:MAG: rhamnose ABC transporter substrate-binding protein [Rubrivivax sp.]
MQRIRNLLTAALAACSFSQPALAADKIALVVKSLGNGFFDAARQGAQEAAKEIGGLEIIYAGPAKATAEGQVEIVNALIAQNVKAIAISANDPDALVPVLKKAMQRGIKVMSFDSMVRKDGRQLHLAPSSTPLIGRKLAALITEAQPAGGEVAVLSATAQATNQNAWIAELKTQLATPAYASVKLVGVVYGDDQTDKSYREAQGLMKSHPNLKVIVAPTTVGVAAAARAVQDERMVGKVFVTGLGLPSEMVGHVKGGAVKSFAIWNPVDLGYSVIQTANALVKGTVKGAPGETVSLGRVGKMTLDANAEGAMAEPFTFNAANVEKFAKLY